MHLFFSLLERFFLHSSDPSRSESQHPLARGSVVSLPALVGDTLGTRRKLIGNGIYADQHAGTMLIT
jgi:hypothetical protein